MKITIEPTTKLVLMNGVPARVWEGTTDTGIKVHIFVTRVAVAEMEPASVLESFARELQETRAPSPEVAAYPLRLVL